MSLPIRDWRVMVLAVQTDCLSDNLITVDEEHHVTLLIKTKEQIYSADWTCFSQNTGIFYCICAHHKALRESLFTYTGGSVKSFIAKCIVSIQKTHFIDQSAQKSAIKIIGFIK